MASLRRHSAIILTTIALGGCTTFNPAQDRLAIESLLAERGAGELGWESNGAQDTALMSELDSDGMTLDLAIKTAMVRSPQLQEVYGQLGLARADVLDAIQIANPRIGVSSLALQDGPGSQFSAGIAQPLVDLLTLPAKSRLAHLDYERARYAVAGSIYGVSLDVEAAWYQFIAAQQIATMRGAVADALQASADLAQRFYDAGNITELQLNQEKAAATEARIDAVSAKAASRVARLALNNELGLTGKTAEWTSSASLALPVAIEDDPALLQQMADASSLELLAARKGAKVAERAATIVKRFRLLGATTIGYDRERETDRSIIKGPTLDLELPIFNQGGARVARAEAQLRLARARLARLELSSINGVALGSEKVRVLSEIVTDYRSALVPQREIVANQSQLEQNYALIGQFEVLQARTRQYDAYQGLIEALRDYWLARVELTRLVGTRLPSDAEPQQNMVSAEAYLTPPPEPAGPSGHHHGGGLPEPGAPPEPTPPVHDHGGQRTPAPSRPAEAPADQSSPQAGTPPPAEHHHGDDK